MSSLVRGEYAAHGVDAQLGLTNGGKEQVAVELEIEGDDFGGSRITWFGFFTEKTVARTMESLRILGWDGDDLSDLSSIRRNRPSVRVVLDEETYEGKTRLKVKWINAAGGIALKTPMAPDAARSFAERMRGAAVASRAKLAAAGVNGFRDDAPPPDDSDIPFAWLLVLGLGAMTTLHAFIC